MTNTPVDSSGRRDQRAVERNPSDAVSGSEFAVEDLRLVEDPAAPQRPATAPDRVHRPVGAPLIEWLQRQGRLEPLAGVVGTVAERVAAGARRPILRGEWLGHPLHPVLTDLPIGCWTSATLLDVFAGRRARPAATLLIGAGVLATVPTIAAGLADYTGFDDQRSRRVATAHAGANAAATALYALSWRSRRHRRHLRGVAFGLAGGVAASLAGFIGGHLAFSGGDAEQAPPS